MGPVELIEWTGAVALSLLMVAVGIAALSAAIVVAFGAFKICDCFIKGGDLDDVFPPNTLSHDYSLGE